VRARAGVLPLVVAVAVVVLLAGCSEDRPAAARIGSGSHPQLGGTAPPKETLPDHPMDRLEKPVAERLARRIAHQGLTLQYLDCPHWDGVVPSRMSCRGYVDGLVAKVQVLLKATVEGRAVSFDAWLADGMIATRTLEATLRRKGWTEADCGAVAAYPARVGDTITCRVRRSARTAYVVATVSSRAGAVTIADYRPRSGDR
jgi:hypothetical protein